MAQKKSPSKKVVKAKKPAKAAPQKGAAKAKKAAPVKAVAAKKPAKPVKAAAKVEPKKTLKAVKPQVAAKAVAPAAKGPAPKVAAKPVVAPEKSQAPAKKEKATPTALKSKKVKEEVEEVLATEAAESEIILTNADGKRYCKIGECDELATSDSYCRYHYLLNWKKIQLRKRILAGDKLNRYIEELTARYPDKYLEMIRKDLASDKDFLAALQELEIDESGEEGEFEDDSKSYIDEVRGTIPGQDEDEY